MEINIKESHDVKFFPKLETNRDIIATMSMAVIKVENYYQTLYRQVQKTTNQSIPTSVLAFAQSKNGTDFDQSGTVVLKPQQFKGSEDQLAVEDPTIVQLDGVKYIFHTAVKSKENNQGIIAATRVVSGSNLENLDSNRQMILDPKEIGKTMGRNIDMVKEPEFIRLKNGRWIVFYEFADGKKSRIGTAWSQYLTGPYQDHRLIMDTREGNWDSQHLSPGPIVTTSQGDLIMFYNGRGPKNNNNQTPQWSIGSVIINPNIGNIIENSRCNRPIITPPPEIGPDNQLIAFANSIVSEEQKLYYTVADTRSRVAHLALENL